MTPSNPHNLQSMPAPIFYSTLQARTGFLGGLFCLVADGAQWLLGHLVRLSPLVLLAWPFMFFIQKANLLSEARLQYTLYFTVVFACCIIFHWLELFMAIPWRGLRYPVVLAESRLKPLLSSGRGYSLSMVTGVWALLLWLTWYKGWQDWAGEANTLRFALGNTALAATMYLYGRFPPYYLLRKPSREDRQWLRAGHCPAYAGSPPAGAITGAQATASPAPSNTGASEAEYATPVHAAQPRTSFAHIFGMETVKQRLIEPARMIVAEREVGLEPPQNGILLHGTPGNGKTVFAESLAGELRVPLVALTYGDVVSKWIGQTPRQVSNCFAYAKANAPCVLFIDEVDSFLRSRDASAGGPEDLKITNTMLTEIVSLRGHRVVLVAATNYLASLDAAAIREGRFDFKIEITPPDEPARIGLLRQGARRHASGLVVDAGALESIARRWNGFSVSRLLAVTRELPVHAREHGIASIGFDEWIGALRRVQGSKGQVPASTKRLHDLYLATGTREALASIARRLRDAQRVEALGGTLPGGVLFYGPPGTGKTVAAQALALESGWAFLSVVGSELLADRERMAKLYRHACDLRPALIFIDEADDVLRHRAMSATPDVVNRLLALMDGSGTRIRDVVFIAATNHADEVDPALLRAGRFTEKICFEGLSDDQVALAVQAWLQAKRVELHGVSVAEVVELLSGRTMADVNGVMQYALNRAITGYAGVTAPAIQLPDIEAGARTVLA